MTSTENIKYIFEVVGDEAVEDLNAVSKGLDAVGSGFKQLGSISKSFSRTFTNATKSVNVFKKAMSSLSGVAVGKVLAEGTKSAIDFYETLNLFNVAMKDSIDTGEQFIDTVSEWYGLDPKNLMDYTGLFYEMAYAAEAPDEAARILSTSLTSLSVDLASLFNVDVEQVADNLTSGLRGMSRAVVKYGLDLRATTVEAYANSLGITEQYETMNEASREILRYLVMVKQARDATGDFGRTIEQPANQMRVFKEQVTQLGRAISSFLVQPLQALLPVLNGTVMALRIMLETIAALMGITTELAAPLTGLSDTSEGFDSIGASADAARKKVKAFLAPFDELNVMQKQATAGDAALGVGVVDPVLLEQLRTSQYLLSEVRMKALDTRDAILAFFGFVPGKDSWVYSPEVFEQQLKSRMPGWQQTIAALFNFDTEAFLANVSSLFSTFARIATEALQLVGQHVAALFGIEITDSSLAGTVDGLNGQLVGLHDWLVNNEAGIATVLAAILEGFVALSVVAPILDTVGNGLIGFGLILTGISGAVSVVSSTVGGITGVISTVFSALEGFVTFLSTTLGGPGLAAVMLFVAGFVDGFKDIWINSETFRESFGTLIENIKVLLSSLVDLVKSVVGQVMVVVSPIVQTIGDILQPLYPLIVNIINAIVGAVTGVVQVLDGILNFDLVKVFSGFMKILLGLVEAVVNLGAGVVNTILSFVVGIINGIGRIVYGIIENIFSAVNSVAGFLGFDGFAIPDKSLFVFDKVPQIEVPSFDYAFATGGVVTGPTRALIGEAGRAEAVIPLDNSPQMNELVNKIASAVSGDARPVEVHVYLDSNEVANSTYDELERIRVLRGKAYGR